jgi:hypothetical protein
MVPQGFGQLPVGYKPTVDVGDLGAGVQTSLAVLGYRGGKWWLKYSGEEKLLTREDGEPRGSLELVIIRQAVGISKIYYKNGYDPDNKEKPDCFSNTGLHPDPQSRNAQSTTCAACQMNAWGSRITPAGKQGKACQDSQRLVVVPLNDMDNEAYGGPMLLRVPAASLQDMKSYGIRMKSMGFPYNIIGTRISFDPATTYPKFVFKEIRALKDFEIAKAEALFNDPRTVRILSENSDQASTPQLAAPKPNFDVPHDADTGEVIEAKAEPAPVKRTYKKAPAAPAPVAAPIEVTPDPVDEAAAAPTGTSLDDALTSRLNAFL